MSVGHVGKTTNDMRTYISLIVRGEIYQTWHDLPGEIVTFNADMQTASVRVLYRPMVRGQRVDIPTLRDVPVRMLRTNGYAMTMPVSGGTIVTLRPLMFDSESYHTENNYVINEDRFCSLSDVEAHIDGAYSLMRPIANYQNSVLHLRANEQGTIGVRVTPFGQFALDGLSGNALNHIASALESINAALQKISQKTTVDHVHSDITTDVAGIAATTAMLRTMIL